MASKTVIKNQIEEFLAKDIYIETQPEFMQLYNAAKIFINNVRNAVNIAQQQKKFETVAEEIKSFYGQTIENNRLIRYLTVEGEKFESAVNAFLNRDMYLTYITEDGTPIFYGSNKIKQLYGRSYAQTKAEYAGRGNIFISLLKDLESDEMQEDIQSKINKSVQKRKEIYTTAIQRWESDKPNKETQNLQFYYKQKKQLMLSIPVKTRGRIAEAYMQLVVDEKGSNSRIEQGLKLLNDRIDLDIIPAVVKGDVFLKNENGEVHFAVKQGNLFSTAKLGPYYHLASNIIQMQSGITPETFKMALPKIVNTSSISEKILKVLNEKSEKAAKKEIEAIVAKYSKK